MPIDNRHVAEAEICSIWPVPFPDELASGLAVVEYDPSWRRQFRTLAARKSARSPARCVNHIGSTSVPGLAAKDCIDVQVQVDVLAEDDLVRAFSAVGFRLRPEPWNRIEPVGGARWPKLVFAPPIGERPSNVHVREAGSASVRRNLLFRDFLRADEAARAAWGDFKRRLAQTATEIYDYGQIKSPANEVLMIAAEDWARRTVWTPGKDCAR